MLGATVGAAPANRFVLTARGAGWLSGPACQNADTMKTDELKALQAPLKDQYRQHPGKALVTLRAQGRAGEGISCRVETGKALVEAGLHPATGGSGVQAC